MNIRAKTHSTPRKEETNNVNHSAHLWLGEVRGYHTYFITSVSIIPVCAALVKHILNNIQENFGYINRGSDSVKDHTIII